MEHRGNKGWAIPADHTLYAFLMTLQMRQTVTVGKLGTFLFEPGLYVYVGSGKRNIQARIERHLRRTKAVRWHVDYIRQHMIAAGVMTFPRQIGECLLAEQLLDASGGTRPMKHFGSSDCRCDGHLLYVKKAPDAFFSAVNDHVSVSFKAFRF